MQEIGICGVCSHSEMSILYSCPHSSRAISEEEQKEEQKLGDQSTTVSSGCPQPHRCSCLHKSRQSKFGNELERIS